MTNGQISKSELSPDDRWKKALSEIASLLQERESDHPLSDREIWKLKLEICRKYSLDRVPKNSEILGLLGEKSRQAFEKRLRRKSIRTASGIAVITVITKPFNCPHGTCTFCPGGVRYGTPQSYTKNSPAAAFGMSRSWDAKRQMSDMLDFLKENGHSTSKVELILLGGTILAMPQDYQTEFVRSCYDALDSSGIQSRTLSEAMRKNELSDHRCVGLTIETKPDWSRPEHVDMLLSYGATRVEIGVQSLREEVLKATNRGHTLKDTREALQVSKDSCLKTVAHMMPGLPKSDPDKDLQDLINLFEDENFRPDMLKIYPTLVVEGTALYQQYRMGHYSPYNLEVLVDLLCKFKSRVPPWVRIMRIQREIPKEEVSGGASAGNLRQIVLEEMTKRGATCRCIRCREIGHRQSEDEEIKPRLKRIDYLSSGGTEIFLSFEEGTTDTLLGFLRLRIPSGAEHREEIKGKGASLVRELHVYGTVVPLGQRTTNHNQAQHKGLGSKLLCEAERISSEEFSKKKIVIVSAVGTKEYYRKRGYRDDGPFVSKILSE